MSTRAARKTADQLGLFPSDQPDLFGEAAAPRPARYVPSPEIVRNSARDALEKLQEVAEWGAVTPPHRQSLIRSAAYYVRITADRAEAIALRAQYEAELARLDSHGPRQPPEERLTWGGTGLCFEPDWGDVPAS